MKIWLIFLSFFSAGCANMVEINPNAINNVAITDRNDHYDYEMAQSFDEGKILRFFQDKTVLLEN
jgi:hypothetical protein